MKARTSNHNTYSTGSHVMQYGDIRIDVEELERYLGFDPANENVTKPELPEILSSNSKFLTHVPQREADLLHLRHKVMLCDSSIISYVVAAASLFSLSLTDLCINRYILYVVEAMDLYWEKAKLLDNLLSDP